MEVKTYTKRTNARRAGVAAGVRSELVEVTVHKQRGEVRFGWKQKAADSAAQGLAKRAPSTPGTSRLEKRLQPPAAAPHPQTRNGVRRPKPGGLCAQVWEWLDAHPTATVKDAKAEALAHGWNVGNATCEFYAWRKWNHIARGNL